MSVGKRVGEIPAHAQEDDFWFVVAPFVGEAFPKGRGWTWTLRSERTDTSSHLPPAASVFATQSLLLSHHNVRKGERLSYHGIYFAIEKIGELAGVPELHPHHFRHSFATDLLLQGLDPSHARGLTGHKSEKAFRRYTLRSEQEAAIAAYYRAIGEEARD